MANATDGSIDPEERVPSFPLKLYAAAPLLEALPLGVRFRSLAGSTVLKALLDPAPVPVPICQATQPSGKIDDEWARVEKSCVYGRPCGVGSADRESSTFTRGTCTKTNS